MPAKGKGKPKKNQHQLCKLLPPGEVLTDLQKKTWNVQHLIRSNGYGLIYLADKVSEYSEKDNAPYVIKVRPHENGPLFCEISFYQRAARSDQIETWKKRTKVPFLGVPSYIAHGLHERNKEKLRFLVMPRFGSDLHNLWLKAGKKFKRETVAKIAIMMLDALHYMHEKEYVHADIKGANILCGYTNSNKLYLVNYSSAYRYMVDNSHKKYMTDPKNAHNGTIEYTSTDAHEGANPSRRGDMEILGFFLVHLLCGRLPWEDKLSDCAYVRDAKINALDDVKKFVRDTCKNGNLSEIVEFLQFVVGLDYYEEPDYKKLQNIFKTTLKSMGISLSSPLDFSVVDEDIELPTTKKSRRAESVTKTVSTGKMLSLH
ncbi:serine/threonine-protein kinase VRK1-like [Clavelina lepadiformis]|uniref:serine/threonine-protein kinase VRK1-like n=1 Tax=Clavelina lepadiformis TaxID=159417 RepID=UPI0040423F08